MAYMNYTPDEGGGSNLTVSPGAGGGGGIPERGPYGGGGNEAFMEMLAMSREDKLRRQREQEAMAQREMLMREGQARQTATAELGRAQFAREQLRSGERGQAQRLALEGSRTRSQVGIAEEQRKEMQAQREARSGFVPTSVIASRPGVTGGIVQDPSRGTVRQRQMNMAQGAGFTEAGSGAPGGQAWRDDQERRDRRNAFARPDMHRGGSSYGGDRGSYGYTPPQGG